MQIKRIKVSNFKSFGDLDVELGDFNVLIGANASGKSNFVQIFDFLRNIARHGLENAVSMIGGAEFLMNLSNDSIEEISIEMFIHFKIDYPIKTKTHSYLVSIREVVYKITLRATPVPQKIEVKSECVTQICSFKNQNEREGKIENGEIVQIRKDDGSFDVKLNKPKEVQLSDEDLYPRTNEDRCYIGVDGSRLKTLLHDSCWDFPGMFRFFLSRLPIYDIKPDSSLGSNLSTGKAYLEDNGSNLVVVLRAILSEENNSRKLHNLVGYLLPSISAFKIDKTLNNYTLHVNEKYFKDRYLPSSLMSQGTIGVLALIVAIYFENNKTVIFEEPERNIHPSLISKVVEMMKEVSKDKQIIITTHHPEVVRYAGIENLLLVSRDKQGFSQINRPADKERVKTFLENEIGITDLYIDNLLGE